MTTIDDERERIRQECHADLAALRNDNLVSERAFRLFEKLVSRLDRLETGSFPQEETPTVPERRPSSTKWSNEGVIKALEEGRKKDEE
jgi:hypothetical protein